MNLRTLAIGSLFFLAAATSPSAHALVEVEAAGRTATATIDLSGVTAELILTFDEVQNLTPAGLGIDARLLDAADLLTLASRLPDPALLSVPTQLPLLVTVEPQDGLALSGTVRVELHTHLLPYTAGSNFRLFKAPLGGSFVDITDEVAPGSVRTRGTTGGFSEFLVLTDLRPTSSVIDAKFAAARVRLAAVGGSLQDSLAAQLDAAEAAVDSARYADAIAAIDEFRALVSAHAGSTLADDWTPADRGNNVAGDLQSHAATLRFSIGYLRDFGI